MQPLLPMRLAFDLVAAALLVFGLSYWWLGNVAHEIAGTAMFLLLLLHNVFNRRFYGRIAKTRRDTRALFNVVATVALLVAMLTLLVTSVLISNALSGLLSAFGGFTVRQIHVLAAYWALVCVAVHLGLRWPLIMDMSREASGLSRPSLARTWVLRLIAAALAAHGVWSSFQLGLGGKLTMQVSLDWWNFDESVAGFFIHCLGIAALYVALSYYGVKVMKAVQGRMGRA